MSRDSMSHGQESLDRNGNGQEHDDAGPSRPMPPPIPWLLLQSAPPAGLSTGQMSATASSSDRVQSYSESSSTGGRQELGTRVRVRPQQQNHRVRERKRQQARAALAAAGLAADESMGSGQSRPRPAAAHGGPANEVAPQSLHRMMSSGVAESHLEACPTRVSPLHRDDARIVLSADLLDRVPANELVWVATLYA
eukprot:gnl/TRDRNA2_/TRDRNA2_171969_c0_seq3.p1 gnl/TRDRNA2_/TRDRNA2_171969_c0~~gnl/TRDRNA2_/TRDRNA2_171969_c0_seq3.p1  ORF type:complete len:195 (+),score=24.54 gnl/TRDRNA2_/TRDRNA2_171969_c0_seq3:189-773(+)